MTAAISIIVAVVLTARAWRAAHRYEGGLLPAEHLLIFLLMTGMFQTGGFSLGMNLSAWRLLIWVLLVGLVLARDGPGMPRLTAADLPIALYGVFLLWCIYRLTETPSMSYGVRNLLKVFYPFMVLMLARKSARMGHFGIYLVPMIGASLIISVFTSGVSEKVPYLVYNRLIWGVFWPRATFADHAAIMVGVILVMLWVYKGCIPPFSRRIYIFGTIWLMLSPLAVGSRTGLLATAAAISGYALARYRLIALPIIGGLVLLGAAALAFVPWIQAHTFFDSDHIEYTGILRGDVDMSNINSSGRFAMWEDLLDRFYHPNPLKGSGLGATQNHMYESSEGLYGGLQAAHSDYVTLLCDTGFVGLVLYLSAAISAVGIAAKYMWAGTTMELRAAGALVLASFFASLCSMGFDNVFNYTLAVHSLPFAFLGILLGMLNNEPSHEIVDPWLWSREYIWSRLFLVTRSRFESMPQAPPTWLDPHVGDELRP